MHDQQRGTCIARAKDSARCDKMCHGNVKTFAGDAGVPASCLPDWKISVRLTKLGFALTVLVVFAGYHAMRCFKARVVG
jgi:hypothetical protein